MRRPVVFLFLFYTLGIVMEYRLMTKPVYFLAFAPFLALVLIAAVKSRLFERYRERIGMAGLFLLVMIIGSLFFYHAESKADPLESMEGTMQTVEGRIITVQAKDVSYFQMLITANGSGRRIVQVQGDLEDPAGWVGKQAVVRGKVILPAQQRNPELFDYRLYLKTKGVRVILQSSTEQIQLRQDHSSIPLAMMARLKYGFLNRLEREMNPEAYGMMVGMLFGDCSFISDDVYEEFQKNGVAHILSVSGIHVAIVYLFVSRLLGNRKTRAFYATAAVLLIFYAALSEFSPCVVRSVIMILIHIYSKIAYRRYDFMTCTAASALGMLVYNPFYLFNTGFQLSYLAVFWLAAMLPWAERRIKILEENGAGELLTESLHYIAPLLIIQLGMAPATAYLFNYFSIVSFIVNPPIIAISGIIIPLGIFLIPVAYLGGFVFGVCAQAAELLTDFMIWLNELFFLPGVGFFSMSSPKVLLLFLFYGSAFFFSSEYFRILFQRKKKGAIGFCCISVLVVSLVFSAAADKGFGDAELVFLDVGQGDCLYIHTPEGKNILIDGGGSQDYKVGEKILLPYLLKHGVKTVDLAVVTHLHDDHYLGIKELAGEMKIEKLGVFEANRLREQEILNENSLKSSNMIYLGEGDVIRIGKEVRIEVMYPEKLSEEEYRQLMQEEKDENRSSLILKVYYRDLSILMTGDLGFDGEQEILEFFKGDPERLKADVLKVGHHGSRYSTSDAFLDAVSPEAAVFQVGKNNFGHPHPTVIEKCSKKGIMIYRNDLNGAIIFEYDENQWNIVSMILRN